MKYFVFVLGILVMAFETDDKIVCTDDVLGEKFREIVSIS